MRFSIITPNYNGSAYLNQTVESVLAQRKEVDLEYIIVDGGSTDGSIDIMNRYRGDLAHCLIEADTGPANAINKGLKLASGDVIAWLNADDLYLDRSLARVRDAFELDSGAAMCFGSCEIINSDGATIRDSITRFKELFFPLSSRFTYQCINYISQPALFFRKEAVSQAGFLRENMVAAWDYDYILRIWHYGGAKRIKGDPLSCFRWSEHSISGENFKIQFKEEFEAARRDAGTFSVQTALHFMVRWGIVGTYSLMSGARALSRNRENRN